MSLRLSHNCSYSEKKAKEVNLALHVANESCKLQQSEEK